MSKRPSSPTQEQHQPPSKIPKLLTTTTAMSITNLLIKRVSEKGKLPTRGSGLAAGYDLYSAETKTIPARGKALVDTQISIAVPEGTYGRVAPRSGLASKHMIDTGAGVIDADYRGILFVLLFNHGEKDFVVNEGDRIAQLILEKIVTPEVIEVDDLSATTRGAGGFGSTGGFGAAVVEGASTAAGVAATTASNAATTATNVASSAATSAQAGLQAAVGKIGEAVNGLGAK